MIRGNYRITKEEQAEVIAIVGKVLEALALDQRHIASLSEYDIAPCHVREAMRALGWEDDNYDRNGWENDTWIMFSQADYPYTVYIHYCGDTFSMEMYRGDIDDE